MHWACLKRVAVLRPRKKKIKPGHTDKPCSNAATASHSPGPGRSLRTLPPHWSNHPDSVHRTGSLSQIGVNSSLQVFNFLESCKAPQAGRQAGSSTCHAEKETFLHRVCWQTAESATTVSSLETWITSSHRRPRSCQGWSIKHCFSHVCD